MVNKANKLKSIPEDESTLAQDANPETTRMGVPPARPVRQRQRSPKRPLAASVPASTRQPAVDGRGGPPRVRSEADQPEKSDDAGHGSGTSGEGTGYSVGYGRPPKHAQFKKGQSGNPAGRARGSRNLRTIYLQERDARIEISENGRRRKVPKIDVLMKQTFKDALSGNPRARDAVLKLESLYGTDDPLHPLQGSSGALAEDVGTQDERDVELLADFKQWILEQEDEVHLDPQAPSASEVQPAATNGGPEDCPSDPGAAELLDEDPGPSPGQATPSSREHDVDRPVHRPLRGFRDGEWH